MRVLRLTWFLIFLILISSCNSKLSSYPYKAEYLEAQDFRLKSIYGREVSLGEYLGEKPVLILFWTTWCPYCRSALIDLKEKREYLSDKGIEVLAINIGESPQKVINLVERIGFNFEVLLDRDSKVSDSYGLLGVLTCIIINRLGRIVFNGNRFSIAKLKELNLEE